MIDVILDWLLKNYPLILGAIVIAFLSIKGAKFYYLRFTKVEDECKKISGLENVATINGNTMNRIEKNIDDKLLPKIDSMVASLNGLVMFLNQKHKDLQSNLFVVKSPVELSPIGERILMDIGGKNFIDIHSAELIRIMDGFTMKSALDVQIQAANAIVSQFSSDNFTPIKNYLFQNPIYRIDGKDITNLDLPVVSQIMGIYLRNKYFELHPELRDKEDPKNNKTINT